MIRVIPILPLWENCIDSRKKGDRSNKQTGIWETACDGEIRLLWLLKEELVVVASSLAWCGRRN